MQIANEHPDDVVGRELGQRIQRLRLERNLDQRQLASEAGIGRVTLQRLEEGKSVNLTSLLRVLRGLGLLERVNQLVPDPVPSPIEQLERGGRQRQRARPSSSGNDQESLPWSWRDEGERGNESSS